MKLLDHVQKAADELIETINDPVIEKTIETEISGLKHETEVELEAIMSRNTKLNNIENVFCDFTSTFENYEEKVSSLRLYITESIPSSFEETRKVLDRIEVCLIIILMKNYLKIGINATLMHYSLMSPKSLICQFSFIKRCL